MSANDAPWLDVIGIGEDGLAGLSGAARAIVESADVIIGGDRHHDLTAAITAERRAWPSPFDAMIEEIRAMRGRKLAILVTGDPLWYSVGARFLKTIPAHEIRFHPQLSAFQWAACRMGWSLADLETLTVHGHPAEQAIPFFYPDARLLILTKDRSSPAAIAKLLTDRGLGASNLTVLGALGGANETRIDGVAKDWSAESPDFHVLAAELIPEPHKRFLPKTGLPDDAFKHDGKMTKQEVRAITLAKLAPRRGETLWDIGSGCGSIAIEWMRADRDMAAIGLEPDPDRRRMAAENALALGAPRIEWRDALAPRGLASLPQPNAVFIGGGLSRDTAIRAINALPIGGRLVANAVTLESEGGLTALHAEFGGELVKLAISRVGPVGPFRGWRPLMPVTQWSIAI
jgi:precorrin-6Y C5,15-methyltransferase (decarboxylating)